MSSMPLVSIVIPCFNAEAWIGETIVSALAQRSTSLEIVLVDDGSTDASVSLAERMAGDTVRVIRQRRQGVSRARNVGTEAARGEFIQYLDADDLLVADTLVHKVSALQSGADVAYGDWTYWERGATGQFQEGEIVRRTVGDRPDIDIFGGKWWPLAALLYRRTLVEKMLPWREDLPIIQDARFLLDVALCGGRFVHVGELTARYRVLPESLSRRDPRTFFEDCYRNGAELHHRWEAEGTFDAERRRCVVGLYGYLARSFFPLDRQRFHDMVDALQKLEPNFVPDAPPSLRALATVVGYPTAEHLAGYWRMARTLARRTAEPSLR
jgi:glycosyltransferase involved in cell wall biosynthesis